MKPEAGGWVDMVDVVGGDAGDDPPEVAVLLPCRDEEAAVGRVVAEFRAAVPDAVIYVYDNNSTDATADVARAAGAVVRHVYEPGKGNVLRRMFAEIDAMYYVVCDGDGTYETAAVVEMLRRARRDRLDMVIGCRVETGDDDVYRRGHRLGNRLLTGSVRRLFGGGPSDLLSGYRVLSRRYVKSFPATSTGFETETEMAVHALDLSLAVAEVPTVYRQRPAASSSKLRTVPDGVRISRLILHLLKDYRPLLFFGGLSLLSAVASVAVTLGFDGPHADRWTPPMALAVALAATALGLLIAGAVADVAGRRARELKRILFLAISEHDRPRVSRPRMTAHAVHAVEA